jgi:hypothetical protein
MSRKKPSKSGSKPKRKLENQGGSKKRSALQHIPPPPPERGLERVLYAYSASQRHKSIVGYADGNENKVKTELHTKLGVAGIEAYRRMVDDGQLYSVPEDVWYGLIGEAAVEYWDIPDLETQELPFESMTLAFDFDLKAACVGDEMWTCLGLSVSRVHGDLRIIAIYEQIPSRGTIIFVPLYELGEWTQNVCEPFDMHRILPLLVEWFVQEPATVKLPSTGEQRQPIEQAAKKLNVKPPDDIRVIQMMAVRRIRSRHPEPEAANSNTDERVKRPWTAPKFQVEVPAFGRLYVKRFPLPPNPMMAKLLALRGYTLYMEDMDPSPQDAERMRRRGHRPKRDDEWIAVRHKRVKEFVKFVDKPKRTTIRVGSKDRRGWPNDESDIDS